jgi:Heterokaryon incompatibility protein (HET)
MRLTNAHTLKLEEVWDENVKEYAILSHRWEDGEVSFQNMQNPAVASNMKGFAKIQKSCEHAVNDGYDYVWVDTCCIDKESSAELTEAKLSTQCIGGIRLQPFVTPFFRMFMPTHSTVI